MKDVLLKYLFIYFTLRLKLFFYKTNLNACNRGLNDPLGVLQLMARYTVGDSNLFLAVSIHQEKVIKYLATNNPH